MTLVGTGGALALNVTANLLGKPGFANWAAISIAAVLVHLTLGFLIGSKEEDALDQLVREATQRSESEINRLRNNDAMSDAAVQKTKAHADAVTRELNAGNYDNVVRLADLKERI